jgi:hypothetical protein
LRADVDSPKAEGRSRRIGGGFLREAVGGWRVGVLSRRENVGSLREETETLRIGNGKIIEETMTDNYKNQIPKLWDEYEIKARYLPCLVSVIPLSHFLLLLLGRNFLNKIFSESDRLLVISNISFPLVLVLCLIQIQTTFSKYAIEGKVFGRGGEYFPTTNMFLLNDSSISQERKALIRNKLTEYFSLVFLTLEDELKNQKNARMQAREVISYIRRKVGRGVMTHQYNIRYGFFRNFIGGCIWAIPGSIGCAILYAVNNEWVTAFVFISFALLFIVLFILKRRILSSVAFSYADSLFNEFLALE